MHDKENPHSTTEAQRILKDTDSAAKNELLFSKYGINYNDLPAIFRKGSVIYRKKVPVEEIAKRDGKPVTRLRSQSITEHVDVIRDAFWKENSHLIVDE